MIIKKFNKVILLLSTIIAGFVCVPVTASDIIDEEIIENIGFKLNNLRMCHQQLWRTLDLSVSFQSPSQDHPNVIAVKKDILNYLHAYSNPKDYWEVLNVNIVRFITEKYPSIDALTVDFSIMADQMFPINRGSTVTFHKGQPLDEKFYFQLVNNPFFSETFKDVTMSITMKFIDNPQVSDYPDFQWIASTIEQFLVEHENQLVQWTELRPMLEKIILEKYSGIASIEIPVCMVSVK